MASGDRPRHTRAAIDMEPRIGVEPICARYKGAPAAPAREAAQNGGDGGIRTRDLQRDKLPRTAGLLYASAKAVAGRGVEPRTAGL